MKKTLLFLSVLMTTQLITAQLYINEIMVSPPGTDTSNEYIEIRGVANATIPADTYLIQIEGDGESNPGDIESNSSSSNGCFLVDGVTPCPQGGIIDLSGLTLGSNGILVILRSNHPYTIDPDAATLFDVTDGELEDQSHTFFLVNTNGNGAPSTNDDIDADDNGEIDTAYTSIWTFLDGISFADDDGAPNNEFAYADVIFAESAIVPTLMRPASATVISTVVQFDYAARIGNSTGNVVNDTANSDWVGGDMPSGNLPNWLLGSNSSSVRTVPESWEGSELNHIGSPNPTQNTLSISQFDAENSLTIYPNPASDKLIIKSQNFEINTVELYSVLGKRVLKQNNLVDDILNISTLPTGVYLLKVTANNTSITKRIIVE